MAAHGRRISCRSRDCRFMSVLPSKAARITRTFCGTCVDFDYGKFFINNGATTTGSTLFACSKGRVIRFRSDFSTLVPPEILEPRGRQFRTRGTLAARPRCPKLVPKDRVGARGALLCPADVRRRSSEVHLFPPEVYEFLGETHRELNRTKRSK
jgi:hypothetical protein